jgi:hypothetical protein
MHLRYWLAVLAGLASIPAWAADLVVEEAKPLEVHFLSLPEGRAQLTEGAESHYFDRSELGEMRAKTGLALGDVSVDQARQLAREAYAASVAEFTPEERAAISEVMRQLRPLLNEGAPLYAREPWSFVKVSDNVEGGMPHTRGESIVLPAAVVRDLAVQAARHTLNQAGYFASMLVHEQTHVMQRRHPEMFAQYYENTLGFRHIVPPVFPDWLAQRYVTNPDGPLCEWIYPIGQGASRTWLLPVVTLRTLDHPHMPRDFQIIGETVEEHDGLWVITDQVQPSRVKDLSEFPDYARTFAFVGENFQPNEISAVLIATLITGEGIVQPRHPLWSKTRAWMDGALR